jgi:dolichol-phosphate mannosyltransferase
MNEITVVLPAYNEEDNIRTMVERWQGLYDKLIDEYDLELQIIVVNDGSKDETRQLAEQLVAVHNNFRLINHARNKGLGAAVKTGIEYFAEQCPDSSCLCLMDCDNTQDPIYIIDMLEARKKTGADVVIASRYQHGAAVKGVSNIRLLMSEGAKQVFSITLGIPGVKDYTCGYRLYGRNSILIALSRFGGRLVEERGFTCMVELLYKLYCCGAVITEIPFKLRYDYKKGSSKMTVLKTAARSFRLALRLKKIRKSDGGIL